MIVTITKKYTFQKYHSIHPSVWLHSSRPINNKLKYVTIIINNLNCKFEFQVDHSTYVFRIHISWQCESFTTKAYMSDVHRTTFTWVVSKHALNKQSSINEEAKRKWKGEKAGKRQRNRGKRNCQQMHGSECGIGCPRRTTSRCALDIPQVSVVLPRLYVCRGIDSCMHTII